MDDIFSQAANPFTAGLAFSNSSTLLDQKTASVADALSEKQGRINPSSVVNNAIANGLESDGGQSYLDVLGSLSTAGIDREFSDIANFVTGNSNPNLLAEADARSGVRNEVRQGLQQATTDIVDDVADARINYGDGNYLDALSNVGSAFLTAGANAPEYIADSVPASLASFGASAISTAGIGGAVNIGKKVYNAGETLSKLADRVDDAVDAKRAASKLSKVAKTLGGVALPTAAIMQRNEEAYIAEHGEPSSALHKAVNLPIAVATNLLEKSIFLKALPSRVGAKAAEEARQKTIKGISSQLDNIPKKYAVEVAKKVFTAVTKATAVGGAEAAQEYAQTWHGILQAKMDSASLDEAIKQLSNSDNIDEANASLVIGAVVGGAVSGIGSTPGIATEATKGVAVNTAKVGASSAVKAYNKASDTVKDSTARASLSLYTPEERALVEEQNKAETVKTDSIVASNDLNIKTVEEATTVEQLLSSDAITERLSKIQEKHNITSEELLQPEVFKSAQSRLVREYKSDSAKASASLKSNSKLRAAKSIGNNISSKAIQKAQSTLNNVDVEQLTAKAKSLGVVGLDSIKNIESSTARGVLDLALTKGAKASKQVLTASRNLKAEDIKTIASVIKEKNPELAAKLSTAYKSKVNALKNLGDSNDSLTVKDNISTDFELAATGDPISSREAPAVFKELTSIINGKIGDNHSLEITQKVLSKYKETDDYKSGTNKVSINVLEKRLQKQANRLAVTQPVSTENKEQDAKDAKDAEDFVEGKNTPEREEQIKEAAKNKKQKEDFIDAPVKVSVKNSEKISKGMSALSEHIKGADKEKQVDTAKHLVAFIKSAGVDNLDDALDIISQYDTLSNSDVIVDAINKAFNVETKVEDSDVVTDEVFDSLESTKTSIKKAKESFTKNKPGCPI